MPRGEGAFRGLEQHQWRQEAERKNDFFQEKQVYYFDIRQFVQRGMTSKVGKIVGDKIVKTLDIIVMCMCSCSPARVKLNTLLLEFSDVSELAI